MNKIQFTLYLVSTKIFDFLCVFLFVSQSRAVVSKSQQNPGESWGHPALHRTDHHGEISHHPPLPHQGEHPHHTTPHLTSLVYSFFQRIVQFPQTDDLYIWLIHIFFLHQVSWLCNEIILYSLWTSEKQIQNLSVEVGLFFWSLEHVQ